MLDAGTIQKATSEPIAAVAQMDQVTQQNAALLEEAAAASESMQDQAAKLAQVVNVFKLAGMRNCTSTSSVPRRAAQLVRLTQSGKTPLGLALARGGNGREDF